MNNIDRKNGKTTSSSKYRLKYPADMRKLPAIDNFKLSHIVRDAVPAESNDVVVSLLDTVERYKKDLKNEIRQRLSMEQKIQFKNIACYELSQKLNKAISQRQRRIERVLQDEGRHKDTLQRNVLDLEVDQVLDLASQVSSRVMKLGGQVDEINKHLYGPHMSSSEGFKLRYPLLYSHISGGTVNKSVPNSGQASVAIASEDQPSHSLSLESYNDSDQRTGIKLVKGADMDVGVKQMESISQPDERTKNEVPTKTHGAPQDDDEFMDPDQFEMFMVSSLSKYRSLQEKRQQINDGPSFFEEHDPFSPDRTKDTHTSNLPNPILLLNSAKNSAFEPRAGQSKLPQEETELANTMIDMKSLATVDPTLLTSHFKKLRINGSPITGKSHLRDKHRRKLPDHLSEIPNDEAGLQSSPAEAFLSKSMRTYSIDKHDNNEDIFQLDHVNDYDQNPLDSGSSSDETDSSISGGSIQVSLEEYSPSPKHVPSHRTLKPKGSILRIVPGISQPSYHKPTRPISITRQLKAQISRQLLQESSSEHPPIESQQIPEAQSVDSSSLRIAAPTEITPVTPGLKLSNDVNAKGLVLKLTEYPDGSLSTSNADASSISLDNLTFRSLSKLKHILDDLESAKQ